MGTRFTELVETAGGLVVGTPCTLPAGTVTNAATAAAANIDESKLNHRMHREHAQYAGADVATKTEVVHVAYRACTVLGVYVATDVAPAGGDKAFNVDVKKSTGGGAYATILTAVVAVNNAATNRTVYPATLNGTPTLIANDLLEIVVTAAGSTGNQAQGLLVDVVLGEQGT